MTGCTERHFRKVAARAEGEGRKGMPEEGAA
jgi:hypothetical protein